MDFPWLKPEAQDLSVNDGGVPLGVRTYVSYGDYIFPPALSLKVQVEPIYDSSGRIPKWFKHTLTFETVISSADGFTGYSEGDSAGTQTSDLVLSQIRRRLSVPGLELKVFGKGIGQNQRIDYAKTSDVGVPLPRNYTHTTHQDPYVPSGSLTGLPSGTDDSTLYFVDSGLMDLNFGPRPVVQVLEPIGSSRTFRLVWSVECALPVCCVTYNEGGTGPTICLTPYALNSTYATNPITEFTYSMSWSIDEQGYTTRAIVGSVEVAGRLYSTLGNTEGDDGSANLHSHRISASTMDVREWQRILCQQTFGRLPGFTRDWQYDLSRDHRRLDFRITDTEYKTVNPYFPGILKCDAKVNLKAKMPFVIWDYTISGSFTAMLGKPKYITWLAFLLVVRSRLGKMLLATKEFLDSVKDRIYSGPPNWFPVTIDLQEDIFGNTCSFNFSYKVYAGLKNIIKGTDFYNQLPGSWQTWNGAMPDHFYQGRGAAQLGAAGPRELLTGNPSGVGSSPYPATAENLTSTCNQRRGVDNIETIGGSSAVWLTGVTLFTPQCPPDKSQTYLDFNHWFEMRTQKGAVVQLPAYSLPESSYSNTNASASVGRLLTPSGYVDPQAYAEGSNYSYDNKAYYQGVRPSRTKLIHQGYALRICAEPKVPALINVRAADGTTIPLFHDPDEESVVVGPRLVGGPSPTPMYMVRWKKVYTILTPPDPNVTLTLSISMEGSTEEVLIGAKTNSTDPTDGQPVPTN